MNNLKKIADLVSFIRDQNVPGSSSAYDALYRMVYETTNSEKETIVKDGDDILEELPLLLKLAETEIELCFELDEDEKAVCYDTLDSVSEFLKGCLKHQTWAQIKEQHLTPDLIMKLRLSASTVKASGVKSEFETEFANKCVADLLEVRDSVSGSTLKEPLKTQLYINLSALIHIFDTINAFGVRDAQDRMKIIIGDVFLNSAMVPEGEREILKSMLGKLGAILSKFRNGVGNVRALEYVAETFDKLT